MHREFPLYEEDEPGRLIVDLDCSRYQLGHAGEESWTLQGERKNVIADLRRYIRQNHHEAGFWLVISAPGWAQNCEDLLSAFAALPKVLRVIPINRIEAFLYYCGRTTGFLISLGTKIQMCGYYEGYSLTETARCVPNVRLSSFENFAEICPEAYLSATNLVDLVGEAILSAPIDTRADLFSSLILSGRFHNKILAATLEDKLWIWFQKRKFVLNKIRAIVMADDKIPEEQTPAFTGASLMGCLSMLDCQAPVGIFPADLEPAMERAMKIITAHKILGAFPLSLLEITANYLVGLLNWPDFPPLSGHQPLPDISQPYRDKPQPRLEADQGLSLFYTAWKRRMDCSVWALNARFDDSGDEDDDDRCGPETTGTPRKHDGWGGWER